MKDDQEHCNDEPIGIEIRRPAEMQRLPVNVLQIIADAARDPNVDVLKMQALLAMHKEITAEERRIQFAEALARIQSKLPQFDKDGKAKNSKYAKLESIDEIVRPFLAEEGFGVSLNEVEHNEKTATFEMVLSHKGGHSEPKRLTVPYDAAAKNSQGVSIRPAIQDAGSSVTYVRRYLLKMHLNIIERGEDTDGEKTKKIDAKDVEIFKQQLAEPGMNLKKFLEYMRVEKLEDIYISDLKKAQTVIAEAQTVIRNKKAETK